MRSLKKKTRIMLINVHFVIALGKGQTDHIKQMIKITLAESNICLALINFFGGL